MTNGQPGGSGNDSDMPDEISLVDLYLIYHRHRRAFWTVVVLFAVVGLAVALLVPRKYAYTTLVEIGAQTLGDKIEPIDTPQSVAVKLRSSYVPQALDDYYRQHPNDKHAYPVTVTTPQQAALVELVSKGSKSEGPVFDFVHAKAVSLLKQDHARILSLIKQRLQTKLTTQTNHLAGLKAQEQQLKDKLDRLEVTQANALANAQQDTELVKATLARLKRVQQNQLENLQAKTAVLKVQEKNLGQSATLVRQQIAKYQGLVKDAENQMSKANGAATDVTRAMTLLMLSNEVQQARNTLGHLQDRLTVDIPNQRESLRSEIADNGRAQQNLKHSQANALQNLANTLHEKERAVKNLQVAQKAQRDNLEDQVRAVTRHQEDAKASIDETRVALKDLRQTRAVALANRSLRPVGMSHVAMAAIAALLGFMVAILTVGILELRARVKERLALPAISAFPGGPTSLTLPTDADHQYRRGAGHR
ncbi:MAG: hypothetical protein P8180_03490 [Gammaproteobacteria bacterium]